MYTDQTSYINKIEKICVYLRKSVSYLEVVSKHHLSSDSCFADLFKMLTYSHICWETRLLIKIRLPIHPIHILKREMFARDLSANKLALALRVPSGRITQILIGKRGISAETALRLSCYFGNSAQFWINLQSRYDLAVAEQNIGVKVIAEVQQASA